MDHAPIAKARRSWVKVRVRIRIRDRVRFRVQMRGPIRLRFKVKGKVKIKVDGIGLKVRAWAWIEAHSNVYSIYLFCVGQICAACNTEYKDVEYDRS